MNTIRVIYDNVADSSTLSASTQSGNLVASNMLTDDCRSEVWRSTATSATLTLTWTTPRKIKGVVLAFTNITSTGTMRVRGYTETADTVHKYDTGSNIACPGKASLWSWGESSQNANSFAYGGYAHARAYIDTEFSVKKLVIDISDASNPAGYIEVGRLICGDYWSPKHNPTDDGNITFVDKSVHYRTENGTLLTDIGPRHKKQNLDFGLLESQDRSMLWNIVAGNATARPIWVSMFPNHSDGALEQTYQIYGKVMGSSAFKIPSYRMYAASVEIEEI